MIESFDMGVDDLYYLGMTVTEQRAHLARSEVQDTLAIDVPHLCAFGVGNDDVDP